MEAHGACLRIGGLYYFSNSKKCQETLHHKDEPISHLYGLVILLSIPDRADPLLTSKLLLFPFSIS